MMENQYETLKDGGNHEFKMKNYERALALYSEAVSINDKGLLAYSNRAMCHIKLGRFYEAISDCDKAISIDSNYTKAYYRRAIANRQLYRFRNAIVDLEKVVDLEPDFELANKELSELHRSVKEDGRIAMKLFTKKPAHLQSSKPIKSFETRNQYSGSKTYC